MATNESGMERTANAIGRMIIGLVMIAVLLGIGYSFWPKIQAAYQRAPISTGDPAGRLDAPPPAADDTVLKAMQAQVKAMQAQLDAARAAQRTVVVQEVPAGEAPQKTTVNTPPAPPTDNGEPAAPPPAPIIIVHQVSQDGAHQTVTGSGACKVSRVAARCGDK